MAALVNAIYVHKNEMCIRDRVIPAYEYRGYIRTITYQYTNGDAAPSIGKTADVQTANVSDTLTYTIKLTNGESASSAWKEVVLTDDLPDGLTFVDSSVYVDGKSAEHSFKDGVLSIAVGDLAAGQTVTVTFKATVNADMYNQTIYNTAVAEGTNGIVKDEDGNETGKYEDTDDGVYIDKDVYKRQVCPMALHQWMVRSRSARFDTVMTLPLDTREAR